MIREKCRVVYIRNENGAYNGIGIMGYEQHKWICLCVDKVENCMIPLKTLGILENLITLGYVMVRSIYVNNIQEFWELEDIL